MPSLPRVYARRRPTRPLPQAVCKSSGPRQCRKQLAPALRALSGVLRLTAWLPVPATVAAPAAPVHDEQMLDACVLCVAVAAYPLCSQHDAATLDEDAPAVVLSPL